MGNIYFTADTHFGDQRLLDFKVRPFSSVWEMNETIINNWKRIVKPEDFIYHLGDLMTKDHPIEEIQNIFGNLPGRKFLIRGNHDHHLPLKGLLEIFEGVIHRGGYKLEVHHPDTKESKTLWLCHYPVERNLEYYTLAGHIHELWKVQRKMLNVGVDVHNWEPVKLERVLFYEKAGDDLYDANVYPDAPLDWRLERTKSIQRPEHEPTLKIIEQEKLTEVLNKSLKNKSSLSLCLSSHLGGKSTLISQVLESKVYDIFSGKILRSGYEGLTLDQVRNRLWQEYHEGTFFTTPESESGIEDNDIMWPEIRENIKKD